MKTFAHIKDLQAYLEQARQQGKEIGLVPTMGALHQGHLSLIKRACSECSLCVASVFVNPTQFNDANDLKHYPRTPERDLELLEEAGCNVVFMPSVEEVYPEPDERIFELGGVANVMEGKHRPGHFNGVAQVVSRLFDIVKPHKAYFGEKDFQQIAVIKSMIKLEGMPIEIVACPIVREADGLAMSSRNARLNEEERAVAPEIAKTLQASRALKAKMNPQELCQWVSDEINKQPGLDVEYYEIVDPLSLESIASWQDAEHPVGCVAVYCGPVRLIDNIRYE